MKDRKFIDVWSIQTNNKQTPNQHNKGRTVVLVAKEEKPQHTQHKYKEKQPDSNLNCNREQDGLICVTGLFEQLQASDIPPGSKQPQPK